LPDETPQGQEQQQKMEIVPMESAVFMENGLEMHLNDDKDKETMLQQMERCLQTLAGQQKLCVELFYLKRMNYSEVAQKSGYDLNQVKSFLQNGKRNLKICIEAGLRAA